MLALPAGIKTGSARKPAVLHIAFDASSINQWWIQTASTTAPTETPTTQLTVTAIPTTNSLKWLLRPSVRAHVFSVHNLGGNRHNSSNFCSITRSKRHTKQLRCTSPKRKQQRCNSTAHKRKLANSNCTTKTCLLPQLRKPTP